METINIVYKAHLTESHQLKAADELISKLKIQLGQEKSYSEEIETELKEEREKVLDLENQLEQEKLKVKKIQDRYSHDVQEAVKLDDVYIRQAKEITELKTALEAMTLQRDKIIYELLKLRDERNS